MGAATQKITDGVQGVQESPTAAAARHLDKYITGTQAAVSSGKMAAKLQAVSLQDWKTATLAKVSRVGSGAQAAKPKMLAFQTQWQPFLQNVRQQIKQMPNTTPEDRIARMVANARALAQFKYTGH